MTDVPMFPVVGHDVETCAGGGRVAPGAAGWLGFAAAPTFRIHGEQLVTRNSRWTPLRRLEINLSHGAAWKALISRYITVIPLIGDEPCIAMQSMSGWPLKKPVHSAMNAKVGAAAKRSQPAAPGATRPPPTQVSTS